MQAISIRCPNCGESLTTDTEKCPSCRQPVVFTSFDAISSFTPLQTNKYISAYQKAAAEHPDSQRIHGSMAMCFLKLKLYDKAAAEFEKAIEDNFEDADLYFYAAICNLKGKKPFLQPRQTIDKIVGYLEAAIMIQPKGIYYFMLAYIKLDYFARKCYSTQPSYEALLAQARQAGCSKTDIDRLFMLTGTTVPPELMQR